MGEKTILEEAQHVVDGPRQEAYGDPCLNHSRTATMWSAFLAEKLKEPLTAADVCSLNILQKMSREAHAHKRDNIVDVAGWARNHEIVTKGHR